MYNLPYFKEQDPAQVIRFLQQHPFAMMIGCSANRPVATQVPVLVCEKESGLWLRGHIMRQTDHHKAFLENPEALFVFTGAHAYVSASWYSQPQTASTWNYMSVHARGRLRFLDEAALLEILEQTTAHFENNAQSPALYHHLPPGYVHKLAAAIVGFEMKVEQLDHVFKLSQNRDRESYQNIIGQLEAQDAGAQTIAAEMKQRTNQIFPK